MKTLIIFLLAATLAFSQTREPSQHTFTILDSNQNRVSILLDTDNDYFKLNNFQIGWHWGSMKVLSRALLMNQGDISTTTVEKYFDPGDFNTNTNYFVRAFYDTVINGVPKQGHLYTHCYYDNNIVFTNGINYDPSLYINPNDVFKLNIREGDPQNPVFGFLNKRGRIPTSQSDPNYSRLIIDSTSLINQAVLSEPWPSNQLTFIAGEVVPKFEKKDTTHADTVRIMDQVAFNQKVNTDFSGGTFYVSINLRRFGINDTIDDRPVLKIEVPFVYRYPDNLTPAYDTAVFDQIPGTNYSMLPDNRGNVLELVGAGVDGSPEMLITRRMLPLSNEDNGDITISGYIDFRKYDFGLLGGNKPLRPSAVALDSGMIDQLKLKITYLGNCNVAIDWIRFETPNTRRLFHGEHDVLIKQGIQHALDTLTKNSGVFNVAGNKPYRFIINVEGGVKNWPAERYMSKLMGDIITGQNGLALIPHYDHYIGAADRWVSYIKTPAVLASPITATNWNANYATTVYQTPDSTPKVNLNLWKTMGQTQGYVKHPNTTGNPYFNIFNSEYETFLFSGESPLSMRDTTMDVYNYLYNVNWDGNPVSTMVFWETFVRRVMFNPMESGFVFSDKPWFSQSFLQSEVKFDQIYTSDPLFKDSSYIYNGGHSNTIINAELYRLMNWNPLILGAKGLMYDGDTDYPDQVRLVPGKSILAERHPGYDTLDGLSFLNLPGLSSDFIDSTYNHISPIMGGLLNTIYNPDTVAKYMGTLPNRLYMGKRSVRNEMRKLHEWIRANEGYLLAQRLQAWFGYGYKLWYKQHPRFTTDSIMNNFVILDSIKTRRLFTVDSSGYSEVEPSTESIYETFVDVTILADTSDIDMKSKFTIGVQSRRTDPLIYFTENEEDKHFLFLSTAELEDLCEYGGKNPMRPDSDSLSPEVWRNYYWKRLGCREVKLKTALIDTTQDIYYRVEELSDGTIFNDTLPWWRKEQIKNRVMVTLKQGEQFSAKYLPAEGKLFKVTIVYDTTSPLIGELAFSNQTKMIAYPANQNSNYDFWKDTTTQILHYFKDSMLYYHVVYDREYSQDKSRVYYRRSAVPYNREHSTKIINWGPEILLSDTIVFLRNTHIYIPDPEIERVKAKAGVDISCKYPSIVVRYDEATDTVRVYVVFSCSLPHLVSHPDSSRIFMVESVFPHDTLFSAPFKAPNNLEPIAWGRVRSNELEELEKYGGVSISAVYSGNMYAFCDTAYGIGVGFKTPDDRGFITNKKYIKYNPADLCSQPSLNTYSRMEINEDNCALVFKEHSEGQDRIIYSRLHNPGGSIDNYVPKIFGDTTSGYHRECYYSSDSSTVILNKVFGQYGYNAEYPVVYRPVSFALRPGYEEADSLHYVGAVWDRVYWQGTEGIVPTSPKSIYMKNVDIDDTQARWWLLPPLRLYSPSDNLTNASPGPGAPSSITNQTFSEFGLADSSIVLNFVQYPFLDTLDYNADVFQINHYTWLNYLERWSDSIPNNEQFYATGNINSLGKGIYPHTTHTPVITKHEDWYIHNRVFQTTGGYIKTSSKLFLKGQADEKTIYPMLSLSDSTKNAQMSEIYMVDNQKSIGLKAFDSPEPGRIKAVDTIFSNWFRVDEIKELGFFSIVSDTSLYRIELESSKGKIDIPVRKDYSKFLTSRKITLLNGKNNLYRIKLIKRNKDINVWVDLLFDTKRDLADMSNDTRDLNKSASQDNSNHQIIDLGTGGLSADMDLRIFPNPASEFIYATGELLGSENQVIVYSLYNSAGLEVFKSEGISGQPIMIPTSDLTTGAYFLKAEQKFIDDYEIKHIISKSVIIQR